MTNKNKQKKQDLGKTNAKKNGNPNGKNNAKKTKTIPEELRLFYLQHPAPILNIGGIVLQNVQTYFPTLEVLFPSLKEQHSGTPTLASQELVVDVSDSISIVEDLKTKTRRQIPIWLRTVHLVNPIDVMSGEFVIPNDGALPSWREAWQSTLHKINDPYNEAYTDAVFACMASRLVETKRSPHFCRFYGTMNTRIPEYSYNITDDLGDIEDEKWFVDGLKSGAFRMIASDPYNSGVFEDVRPPLDGDREGQGKGQPLKRHMDSVDSESVISEIVSIIDETNASDKDSDNDYESTIEEADIEISGHATVQRERVKISRMDCDSAISSTESDYSDLDCDFRVILKNFPVQITMLEKCDGTMDVLMETESTAEMDMLETKELRWTAWIFQVIAGVAVAQHNYDFVHNDLHSNNVVWVGTEETHLYYHIVGGAGGDRYYKVPTFGRIMKIIDFGRATFRPASLSVNQIWFPDAFAKGEDADGQYNCEPYFEHGKPKIVPNKSFDLCRLAVAILDTLWSPTQDGSPAIREPKCVLTRESGRIQYETVSPLWNLMWLWLTDYEGRNILRNPDNTERYPQFDLYCAIARDIHNAEPSQQLTLPLFDSKFKIELKELPSDSHIWELFAQ